MNKSWRFNSVSFQQPSQLVEDFVNHLLIIKLHQPLNLGLSFPIVHLTCQSETSAEDGGLWGKLLQSLHIRIGKSHISESQLLPQSSGKHNIDMSTRFFSHKFLVKSKVHDVLLWRAMVAVDRYKAAHLELNMEATTEIPDLPWFGRKIIQGIQGTRSFSYLLLEIYGGPFFVREPSQQKLAIFDQLMEFGAQKLFMKLKGTRESQLQKKDLLPKKT